MKFDGDDIREVLEMPWVPSALHGMVEDEIDQLDEHRIHVPEILRVSVRIDVPLIQIAVDIPSLFDEMYGATILASLSSKTRTKENLPAPQTLPKHIQNIVLERAVSDGQTCPITLTLIRLDTASVTSCGHIFQTAAIQEWLSENETCPECRGICSI